MRVLPAKSPTWRGGKTNIKGTHTDTKTNVSNLEGEKQTHIYWENNFPYDEKHLVPPNYPKQINGDLRALSIKKGLINMYIPLNAIVLECINRILFMGDKSPPPRSLSGNGKQ